MTLKEALAAIEPQLYEADYSRVAAVISYVSDNAVQYILARYSPSREAPVVLPLHITGYITFDQLIYAIRRDPWLSFDYISKQQEYTSDLWFLVTLQDLINTNNKIFDPGCMIHDLTTSIG